MSDLVSNLLHLPLLLGLLWLGYRSLRGRRTKASGLGRFVKFLLLATLLTVGGCSSTEKLAQAKGPLFGLNPDHWQPAPTELEAPPADINK